MGFRREGRTGSGKAVAKNKYPKYDRKSLPEKNTKKLMCSFTLSWAGKARLAESIKRRSNDKFNTARAFKKEENKKEGEDETE